jgi:hypothetical protein
MPMQETKMYDSLKKMGSLLKNARLLTSRGGSGPDAVFWISRRSVSGFIRIFDEKGFSTLYFIFFGKQDKYRQKIPFGGKWKNETNSKIKGSFDSNYLAICEFT